MTKAPPRGKSARPGIEPDWPEFERRYDASVPQVVSTRLIADLETPVSAYLKLTKGLAAKDSASFLFESVEGGSVRGRYSIIGVRPDLIWRAHGAKAH